MTKALPKVPFKSNVKFDIEVMTFEETYEKLIGTNSHNPFSAHKIQFYLILIVIENTYSHYVDFKSYDLKKGSVLFVAKNQVHYFTETFKKAKGFSVVLNSQFLEQNYFLSKKTNLNRLYNYHLESPVIHSEEMENDEFISSIEKLYFEYHFPNDFEKSEMLRAYIHIILIKAERIKQLSNQHVKVYWLKVFNEFKVLLEVNYVKTRNSRLYASLLFVSYKFLNDVVKKSTGKTIKVFIDDFVTMEIKRYLASTSLSVKEIAYKTGFEESANMIKFFKKNTKKTPLQFRKEF